MPVVLKRFMLTMVGLNFLVLVGCGTESSTSSAVKGSEADNAALQVMDSTIMPAVTQFQESTELLDSMATEFCSDITSSNLTALQNQWKNTSQAWYQVLPFKFGPMEGGLDEHLLYGSNASFIDSYRPNGVNYTGTVRTNISEMIADTASITDETLLNKSFNRVGLLALEVVIFEVSADQSNDLSDIVNEFVADSRKCQILTGLSNQVLERATSIAQGWHSNYAETGIGYRALIASGQLAELVENEDGTSAISKLTVSIQDYFDYLKNRNLTTEMGQLSSSIWQSVAPSVSIIEEALVGTDQTTLSLNDIMNNNGFDQTLSTLNSNFTTLKTAISENNTVDFQAASGVLDGNFKRDIPDALGVTLGLNFSDGD